MLSQAIGVSGDASEMLNDLLTEIDFQEAACLGQAPEARHLEPF
jgi:hypothetical protein